MAILNFRFNLFLINFLFFLLFYMPITIWLNSFIFNKLFISFKLSLFNTFHLLLSLSLFLQIIIITWWGCNYFLWPSTRNNMNQIIFICNWFITLITRFCSCFTSTQMKIIFINGYIKFTVFTKFSLLSTI